MKRYLAALLLIVVFVAIYAIVGSRILEEMVQKEMTEERAVELALSELSYTYSGADVSIYNITRLNNTWKINALVVYGNNTPCPNLTMVELRYPRFGFVPREFPITANCSALGCEGNPGCIIAYPQEAVIMTRKRNDIPQLEDYISRFGYQSIKVKADYEKEFLDERLGKIYRDVWITEWSSEKANYSYLVVINKTGGRAIAWYPT